jgi:hypothetical protein
VLPTRKKQSRDESFDETTGPRRNIVERVMGWHKEYRRPGTRYEKSASNYVTMWLVAIIEKALSRLLPNTGSDCVAALGSRRASRAETVRDAAAAARQ